MRSRHRIVETTADAGIETRGIDALPILDGTVAVTRVELIDESTPPRPSFPVLPGHTAPPPPARDRPSAVPGERPATGRPSLPWGLGTDGWPRHNSRLVRLFACDPEDFVEGVVGRRWQVLELEPRVRAIDGEAAPPGPWMHAISGTVAMPYRSLPLAIELRCQPFQARYTRVDMVVTSHCRWPRRFFDVASRCLTEMQALERPMGRCA